MKDSIFTKIIKGEIPCHKVYEDDMTLAFLDINPVQPGHVLVIPKQQVEFVWDLSDEAYETLMVAVRKVALHMREVSPKKHIHAGIVGTDVPHAHVHLVPFDESHELKRAPDPEAEPDHEALAEMAKKLAF